MNKKLKATVKFINSVACNYVNVKIYIDENLEEKRAEQVIYFSFEFFERMDVIVMEPLLRNRTPLSIITKKLHH